MQEKTPVAVTDAKGQGIYCNNRVCDAIVSSEEEHNVHKQESIRQIRKGKRRRGSSVLQNLFPISRWCMYRFMAMAGPEPYEEAMEKDSKSCRLDHLHEKCLLGDWKIKGRVRAALLICTTTR